MGKVAEGSELVDASGKTLDQIVTAVKKVSDIIAEIAAASREQSSGIEQVNKAMMQMDDVTQQNAALVEQASAAAQAMAEQARGLDGLIARYKVAPTTGEVQPQRLSTPAVVKRPAVQPAAALAERRSGARPWTKSEAKARATGRPAAAQGAAAGTDSEWKEF